MLITPPSHTSGPLRVYFESAAHFRAEWTIREGTKTAATNHHVMSDPSRWSGTEKEKRLRRLFEKIQNRDNEAEFINVEFGNNDLLYQYMIGFHNVTGLDDDMVMAMKDVIDKHDLGIESSSADRGLLGDIGSMIRRLVTREPASADTEWINAYHRTPETDDDAYAVFSDICETVYGYDPSDVTDAVIVNTDTTDISWTDV